MMRTRATTTSSGFSLVELVVVLAIFIFITGIVLYNQNKFSSNISISNAAYAVALQIRQAQVYGILVRQGVSNFNSAYGMHIRDSSGTIVFELFNDIDNSKTYTLAGDGAVINTNRLGEGNVITQVCTYDSAGANVNCLAPSGSQLINIVFKRPDPAAVMSNTLSGTVGSRGETRIYITSALGDKTRTVSVFGSGQISVSP